MKNTLKSKNNKKENQILKIEDFKSIFFITLVLAFVISRFVKPTVVSGSSMNPTLHDKDYLFVNRIAYFNNIPKRGDILIFKAKKLNNKILIKRVIGVEGDRIVIKDKKVYVNNKILNEPYIVGKETDGEVDLTIEKDNVFVMGDNRPNSLDSRIIGQIENKSIIGKVFHSKNKN